MLFSSALHKGAGMAAERADGNKIHLKPMANTTVSKMINDSESDEENLRNRQAVRWYVLVLPSCHKGPARGLQTELERRRRNGEAQFEFFAPSYVEVRKVNGAMVSTERPLLYNYVFVRASEQEIFRIKRVLPLYNFLPRIRDEKSAHYPYLADEQMENLRWIARSYADVVPVFVPNTERLMKGDKVRITEGQFKGAVASIVAEPGAGRKDIMVCMDDWMWVPLLHVQPGQYEVIGLNTDSKHVYTHLNNDRLADALHEALQRHHAAAKTDEDRALATRVLQQYRCLKMDSDVMRSRLYSFLLPAYTLLDDEAACRQMVGAIQALLTLVKAEQSRALLQVTLYGCTDNSIFHREAHALVDGWRAEPSPKKSKLQLLRRLEDYDNWLGHSNKA